MDEDQATQILYGNTNLPEGTPDRPLVTFALFAYNQEKYIREAVEGAFSQTYSPLEIILSDDCSSDRTFEIMEAMAREYSGPHLVKVRKSPRNRRLMGHINDVVVLAEGSIIVLAAGDDVSFPDRTAQLLAIYRKWPSTLSACSNYFTFDAKSSHPIAKEHSRVRRFSLLRAASNFGGWGQGASYSYRRECFYWPEQLPENLELEDRILPFRAAILGNVAYTNKRLLKWRTPTEQGRAIEKARWASHQVLSKNVDYLLDTLTTARSERRINAAQMMLYGLLMRLLLTRRALEECGPRSFRHNLSYVALSLFSSIVHLLLKVQRLFDPYAKHDKINRSQK